MRIRIANLPHGWLGSAEFETAADHENPRELSIRVRGQSFGPYRIGGGAYTVPLD